MRLRLKEQQIEEAIVLAQGVRIDATAIDGLVVPGQRLGVSIAVANRGPGNLGVTKVALLGFDGPGACEPGVATNAAAYQCNVEVNVPTSARLTDVYWQRPENAGRATFDADAPFGLPFRPSPFRARLDLDVAGARIVHELPMQYRYEGAGLVGEKRMELNVIPSFAVSVSPQIVVVPKRASVAGTPAAGRRTARHRHQWREGPGIRDGAAQSARWLACLAADGGADVFARRRVDDDAVHGDAATTDVVERTGDFG